MKDWEAWKRQAKQREKALEKTAKQKKDKDTERDSGPAPSWEASFDPEDPSDQFSFANTRAYSMAKLDEDIRALRWTSTEGWAFDVLRRGIAVHHAGMNKGYRTLVEGLVWHRSGIFRANANLSLFRAGFLRVVIATGTLALGINAPAKTAVFCGDSPYLTALQVSRFHTYRESKI